MNVGALIGGSFGLVYILVNAPALGEPAAPVLQVAGVVAFVALLVLTFRRRGASGPGERPHFDRFYWVVVLAEVAAIFLGSRVFVALELPTLPWVTIVVGLHLLPLARMWRNPFLGWGGAVLTFLGVAGLVAAVAAVAGASIAVVSLLAGVLPGVAMLGGLLWGVRRAPAPVS